MSGRRFYLNIRHKISQFLNPALCLTCGIPILTDSFFCADCLQALEQVPNPCHLCGQINQASGNVCPACHYQPPIWQHMVAPLVYQGTTRRLLHQMKFGQQIHIANAIVSHLSPTFLQHPVQVLLPVPLHPSRLLDRGFNQAREIAKLLSLQLDIPLDPFSLRRIRATDPQSGLSMNKRQKNIARAFIYKNTLSYHSVAIVDDVITTGSTMKEISQILQRAGIKHIEAWSLARALKHDD